MRPYIESLPSDQRHFELFVVTHVDTDHIDGAILLMRDRHDLGVTFGEVWFNDWARIETLRGAKHGELLGTDYSSDAPAAAPPAGTRPARRRTDLLRQRGVRR